MIAVDRARERAQVMYARGADAYEALSEREQKLILAMLVVVVSIVVLLPMYFAVDAIAVMETENAAIKEVLREIEQNRADLRTRVAEQAAARARYATRAPALGSFLESQAQRVELPVREVTDEPEQVLGGFTRRRVRASFQNVTELAQIMSFLENIENSNLPVSIEKIEIDHPRNAQTYTLRIGINAYDRNAPEAEAAAPAGGNAPRRAP
jgi:hypothetical protein